MTTTIPTNLPNLAGQTGACQMASMAYQTYRTQLAAICGSAAPYINMANKAISSFQKDQYDQVMGIMNGVPDPSKGASPVDMLNSVKNTKCDFIKDLLGGGDMDGLIKDLGDALKMPGAIIAAIGDTVKKGLAEAMKLALGPFAMIFEGMEAFEGFLDDMGVYDALDMLAKAEACLMSLCGKSASELKVPGTDMFSSFYFAKLLNVDPEKRQPDFASAFKGDVDAYNKYTALYSKYKAKITPPEATEAID